MRLLALVLLFKLQLGASAAYDPLAMPARPGTTWDGTVRDAGRGREVPVRVHLPSERKAAPVVLFSHGLGGSRNGSTYLGKHWSARGYVAVFLQHPGSDESVWRDGEGIAGRMNAVRAAASPQNYLERVRDVPAVLDELAKWDKAQDHPLAGRLDLSKVGMSGHSFGALTTQAVSGQAAGVGGQRFTDPRIKAALVLSPSAPMAGDAKTAFANVKLPWLLMTATNDIARLGGKPLGPSDVATRLAVYAALPPGDKYQLVLDGAGHSVFTDRADFGGEKATNPDPHRAILALSTAFWDAYLRGDAAAKAWLRGNEPRGVLVPADRWERK